MSDDEKPESNEQDAKRRYKTYVSFHDSGKRNPAFQKILADYFLDKSTPSFYSELLSLVSKTARQKKRTVEEEKHKLVKELLDSDIDPVAFDLLLSNEIDRRLKVRFGVTFIVLTILFTVASYSIVVFDSIYAWDMSAVAITALIIETPIQFVGLLYIIARNLFPSERNRGQELVGKVRSAEAAEDDV